MLPPDASAGGLLGARGARWWDITWGLGGAVLGWPSPCEERNVRSPCGRSTKMGLSISWARIAGIGVLTVILGLVLFLGCWYCRRRNGYNGYGSLKVGKAPPAGIHPAPRPRFPFFL